jgi:hypothetical protein
MENRIEYNQVVNIADDNCITLLEEVFNYSDLKGARGTEFYPVSKAEFEERTSFDNVLQYWMDCTEEEEEAVREKMEELNQTELKEIVFDYSDMKHWDYLRTFGFPEDEYPVFEFSSSGRIFNKDFQGNVNPELSAIIREYESK